jgi:hypothetical protein
MEKALDNQLILNPTVTEVHQMYELVLERMNLFPTLPNNNARVRVRRSNQLMWNTAVKNLRTFRRQNGQEDAAELI